MSQDIERYLKMLQSTDVNQRKQAIIALGKSGDKRVLQPLAKVYKTDPDASLRELALKAGRHVQKQLGAAPFVQNTMGAEPSANTLPSGSSKPAAESEVPDWMNKMGSEVKTPKRVTDRDRYKAKNLRDRALDAQLKGDMEKVVDYLAEAIDLNPELERDSVVNSLLAQATGMDSTLAIKELKRVSAEDAAAGKKKKKSSSGGAWTETIDFVVEMAIWFIVLGLFMSGMMYLAFTATNQFSASQPAESSQEAEANQQLAEEFEHYGPLFSLIVGFIYGAFVTGISVFMSFFAWFVGVTFLGGEGLIYPFLRAMMRVTIVVIFIATSGTIGSFLFGSPTPGISAILGISPSALGIGITAWTIGKVHNFGTAMGCVNMAATVMFCGFLSCALSFLTSI